MLQDRHLLLPKEKSIPSKVWLLAKWVVTLLILSYLYSTFQKEQKGVRDVWSVLLAVFTHQNRPLLLLMLLLVPLNWALESWKWMLLARKAVRIDFGEAFRSTLTGLALGVAVPAQLGDTLGRISSLRSEKRFSTLGAALVSNGVQFYLSVLGGGLSMIILHTSLAFPAPYHQLVKGVLAVVLLGGLLIGILRRRIVNIPGKRLWIGKFKANIAVIARYSGTDLAKALALGALRYLVFVGQFVLALSLFGLPVPVLDLWGCVGVILLVKTLLPAINVIGDLGLREFTALLVFEPYGLSSEKIVAATFLIWLVNILGPLLVGVFLIWKYKWTTHYA